MTDKKIDSDKKVPWDFKNWKYLKPNWKVSGQQNMGPRLRGLNVNSLYWITYISFNFSDENLKSYHVTEFVWKNGIWCHVNKRLYTAFIFFTKRATSNVDHTKYSSLFFLS